MIAPPFDIWEAQKSTLQAKTQDKLRKLRDVKKPAPLGSDMNSHKKNKVLDEEEVRNKLLLKDYEEEKCWKESSGS